MTREGEAAVVFVQILAVLFRYLLSPFGLGIYKSLNSGTNYFPLRTARPFIKMTTSLCVLTRK